MSEVTAAVARAVILGLMTFVSAVVVAAAGSAVAATVAPGVHVDPGSPVAKEYAIPLAQARGAAGGGGAEGGGPASGHLFGSGITRAPRTSPRGAAPAARRDSPAVAPKRRSVSLGGAGQVTAAPSSQAGGPDRSGGGGTGMAWMLGVAAAVLAVGGLGATVLTRLGRRTSARGLM